ncbi:uncharacterized protein LOC108927010 [Scleropages formosus]|uniref:uncharacterized protein LOC108927010 n=1 Tax=Scleropages formosus TaxID=113540 RepID=UPI0010FA9EF9|nr:uncharacterized protein LOC108927010 [Scleropages formosus]
MNLIVFSLGKSQQPPANLRAPRWKAAGREARAFTQAKSRGAPGQGRSIIEVEGANRVLVDPGKDSQPAEVCGIREGDDFVLLEGLDEVEVDSAQSLPQLCRRGAASRLPGVPSRPVPSSSGLVLVPRRRRHPASSLGNRGVQGRIRQQEPHHLQRVGHQPQAAQSPQSGGTGRWQQAHPGGPRQPCEGVSGDHSLLPELADCAFCPRVRRSFRGLRSPDPVCLWSLWSLCWMLTVAMEIRTPRSAGLQGFGFKPMKYCCCPAFRRAQRHPTVRVCVAPAAPSWSVREEFRRCRKTPATPPAGPDRCAVTATWYFLLSSCPVTPPPSPPLRPSLVVTVSPNPSSVRGALKCLRFAGRATGIRGRELRCCPLQAGAPLLPRTAVHLCQVSARTTGSASPSCPPLRGVAPGAGRASPSRSLPGVRDLEAGGRERGAGPTGGTGECPTCRRERAIRHGYDKYVVRANEEREELGQRVAPLEARLRSSAVEEQRQEPAGAPGGTRTRSTGTAAVCEERLQREEEELQEDCGEEKEALGGGGPLRCRAELELRDLKVQREKDRLLLRCLKERKETLSAELEDTRDECERFKESIALAVAQLQKEKVVAENASLKEEVEELLNVTGSRRFCPAHPNQLASSTAALVSHEGSERCPKGGFAGNCSAPHGSPSSPVVANDDNDGDGLLRMKDVFGQP